MNNENIQYDFFLIIKDLPTIRLLTSYFESRRFKSYGVSSGEEGLKILEICGPKLILLDLEISNPDWYEVAKQIKSQKTLERIPLFLYGKVKTPDIIDKAKELGILDIIKKPFYFIDFDIFFEIGSDSYTYDELTSKYQEIGFSSEIEKKQYDILLIEQDWGTIKLLTLYFEREGYTFSSVRNGEEALKELESSQPNVILLDLRLPDMDWFDLAYRIKTIPHLSVIPLFLFGDITEEVKRVNLTKLGLFGVIPKPFCLADFKIFLEYASRNVNDNPLMDGFEGYME